MSNNGKYLPTVRPTAMSGRGWADYLADPETPFPREYESWDEVAQRHYERGRLRAAGAPLAGYPQAPKAEPADIIQRTNGLKLVPRARRRDNRRAIGLQQETY